MASQRGGRGSGRGTRGNSRGRPRGSRGRGVGRPSNNTTPRKVESVVAKVDKTPSMFDDDDDDLTCRVCLSSFWYRTQLLEHLQKTHSVKDPDAYLQEKKSRV